MKITIALAALLLGSATGYADQPCASILVGSREEPKESSGHTFSASRTTDVTFSVLFRKGFSGDHLIDLRVVTPSGHLYQSIAVPVGEADGSRRVDGYARPLKVKKPKATVQANETYPSVEVVFPVGGTSISTSSLYGRWSVQAFLDGENEPCGAKMHFQIKP